MTTWEFFQRFNQGYISIRISIMGIPQNSAYGIAYGWSKNIGTRASPVLGSWSAAILILMPRWFCRW